MSENNQISLTLKYSEVEYSKMFFRSFNPTTEYLDKYKKEVNDKLFYVHYKSELARKEDVIAAIEKYRKELECYVESCINYIELLESYCKTDLKK